MFHRLHLDGLHDLVAELACRPARSNTIAADLAFLMDHRADGSRHDILRRKPRSEPRCHVKLGGAARP